MQIKFSMDETEIVLDEISSKIEDMCLGNAMTIFKHKYNTSITNSLLNH